MKALSSRILKDLDNEFDEKEFDVKEEVQMSIEEITMDFNELQKKIEDMDDPKFWLQKIIKLDSINTKEAAIDYYKQGLRKKPLARILIYNIACCYEKLKKFNNALIWFKHGIDLDSKWTDCYFGCALTYFKMSNYEKAYEFVKKASGRFKQEKSQQPPENLQYLQAMCEKNLALYE
jgi:tetratricopeptide (TPR) repeat protein